MALFSARCRGVHCDLGSGWSSARSKSPILGLPHPGSPAHVTARPSWLRPAPAGPCIPGISQTTPSIWSRWMAAMSAVAMRQPAARMRRPANVTPALASGSWTALRRPTRDCYFRRVLAAPAPIPRSD
jgi:hypothetical protein